ncbi:MAG: hypothetical protein ACXAEI_00135, partial [Candidatus Hodarchaeales archaeon]
LQQAPGFAGGGGHEGLPMVVLHEDAGAHLRGFLLIFSILFRFRIRPPKRRRLTQNLPPFEEGSGPHRQCYRGFPGGVSNTSPTLSDV